MSERNSDHGGLLDQASNWLRSRLGDGGETTRPDGGVEPERVEATAAGATDDWRRDYHEHVSRLIAEDCEKEAEILEIVGQRGGVTPQQDIVEAITCSEAAVSRRLQMLERSGLVVRLARGREKVVCLPEMVPPDLRD